MIKKRMIGLVMLLAFLGSASADDPAGIIRKPIPDRLVVLTFDDGCASGYTVVAPILKSSGFNGSFYVCDFDSFKTRKDWYMTWRQMIKLDGEGFGTTGDRQKNEQKIGKVQGSILLLLQRGWCAPKKRCAGVEPCDDLGFRQTVRVITIACPDSSNDGMSLGQRRKNDSWRSCVTWLLSAA